MTDDLSDCYQSIDELFKQALESLEQKIEADVYSMPPERVEQYRQAMKEAIEQDRKNGYNF